MSAQKRKRISKKTKSAWRKTDIKDVEEFLEDKRQEERIGSYAEKKDDELFILDSTPLKCKPPVLTEKQKRKLNAQKSLRSLEALNNTSKVQDPIVKRNRVNQKRNGRVIEEEIRNPTKPRHLQANKDRERYYQALDKKLNKEVRSSKIAAKDIWVDEDFRDKYPGLKDEKGWISEQLALHVVTNIGKPVVKVHDSIRHRTTKAKKFEAPHPGTSYNPSLKDHQNLLKTVSEREEKIIKVEEHLKRVTTKMFSKVTPEERDRRRIEEMRSGLEDDDTIANAGSDEAESEAYKTTNPPVENTKKSKKSRRKELQQKELKKRHDEKKALKKQIADLNRIKSIKAEVLKEAEQLNALKKHRKKADLKKKFETKRLGRLKFVEPDVDVNMPEDIPGNLRNVKPESSLLVDRFKNFQKRNILPVSVATGKQKAKKVKRFPRGSHKDPGVSFQMLREQRNATKKYTDTL